MVRRPGTPRLLREINDRAALELLLGSGPLTRAQLGEQTGLSKVTASQMLARLEQRGLVEVVGEQAGGRGPNAALYGVVPSSAYVAALTVEPQITAAITDITGEVVAEVSDDPDAGGDPVSLIHNAVVKASRRAQVPLSRLRAFVIGTPGLVDPRTGDVRFAFNLPSWHTGMLAALRRDLRRPVTIENDVNLAAIAERWEGAARDAGDFALMWIDEGMGMALMMDGRLYRGRSGGAGEIGYLPVSGTTLPRAVAEPATAAGETIGGAFQSLVAGQAVRELARGHGFEQETAAECVAAAIAARAERAADGAGALGNGRAPAAGARESHAGPGAAAGEAFLDELARRVALGVASVCVVLDPGLVVLGGKIGRAGGTELAARVEDAVSRICPSESHVAPSEVEGDPILRGALLAALESAREEVFSGSS